MRLLILAMVCGCSPTDDTQQPPQDSDSLDDTDSPVDTDTLTDTGPQPYDSDFHTGRFRFTKLSLLGETDADGDDVVDNNLPNVLATVDLLLSAENFGLEAFNERMQTNIDGYTTIVLADARKLELDVEIDLLQGIADTQFNLSINPESYVEGEPLVQFDGFFFDETMVFAESKLVVIPISFYEGGPTLPVTLEQARFDGALTADLFAGELYGVLPIDELIDTVIDPLIPPNGYDYDNDGDLDPKQEILALISSIAPAAGDVVLGDDGAGGTRHGISARFTFQAAPATWAR